MLLCSCVNYAGAAWFDLSLGTARIQALRLGMLGGRGNPTFLDVAGRHAFQSQRRVRGLIP